MAKIRKFLEENWQLILTYLGLGLGLVLLLINKLSSLTGNLSQSEVNSINSAKSLNMIIDNPVFAPYKLLQYGVLHAGSHKVFYLRLISAVLSLAMVWFFYKVAKAWYTRRIALLGSFLVICSSWFLHVARGATPIINFTFIVALLWCGLKFRSNKDPRLLIVFTLIAGWLLYVPGFIWFLAGAVFWQRREIQAALKSAPKLIGVGCTILFVLFLLPIGWGAFKHPGMLRVLAGLPELSELTLKHILSNIFNLPNRLLYHGPTNSDLWLAGTPIIDFFGMLMASLGAYLAYYKLELDRTRSLVALLILSGVLVILGGIDIVILMPLIYILIASGVAFMLQQWFTVFPRNPIAKIIGPGVLTIAIGLSCFYQLNNYFVAWRHSPVTKQAFSYHL